MSSSYWPALQGYIKKVICNWSTMSLRDKSKQPVDYWPFNKITSIHLVTEEVSFAWLSRPSGSFLIPYILPFFHTALQNDHWYDLSGSPDLDAEARTMCKWLMMCSWEKSSASLNVNYNSKSFQTQGKAAEFSEHLTSKSLMQGCPGRTWSPWHFQFSHRKAKQLQEPPRSLPKSPQCSSLSTRTQKPC